jgi:predicted DNA-binding transcriptional regulator YafY
MSPQKRVPERRNAQLQRVLKLMRHLHAMRRATVHEMATTSGLPVHQRTIRRDMDALVAAGFCTRVKTADHLCEEYVWSLDRDILATPKVELSDATVEKIAENIFKGCSVMVTRSEEYKIPTP